MNIWPEQEAKANFDKILDASIELGPQMVTRHGIETAILVSAAEWQHIQQSARSTLKELLLTDDARFDLPIPARKRVHHDTGHS